MVEPNPAFDPSAQAFKRLLSIIERLRAPDGCPWDREQTPSTLRGALSEETYELIHAINEDDDRAFREELGDVYLVASMVAYMRQQEGRLKIEDALDEVCEKLIRRHPHVFGEAEAANSEQVLQQWEAIKQQEKKSKGERPSHRLDKVGRSLPVLEKAQEIQKKAAKYGFDWKHPDQVLDKVREELGEVEQELPKAGSANNERLEMELGDLLFSVINLSRKLGIDAGQALNRSIEKFKQRWHHIETGLAEQGHEPAPQHLDEMERLWNEARKRT